MTVCICTIASAVEKQKTSSFIFQTFLDHNNETLTFELRFANCGCRWDALSELGALRSPGQRQTRAALHSLRYSIVTFHIIMCKPKTKEMHRV